MPRVSVVVPLYNKEPYVRRALESIAAQTFADFEAIIVDDGSTDTGPEIVAAYADPRFRLLCQPNAGPGAARNRGIEEATGDFIAFLDADDEWLPDYLEHAILSLERHGAATCTAGYVDCPGDRSSEPLWRKRGLSSGMHRVGPGISAELLVAMLAFMLPCSTVSRAHTLRQAGGFYTRNGCRYGEDAFLWLKILLNEPVYFDLAPRVRIHTDAAALSKNLKRARPLEPFLEHPGQIEAHCPPELRPLLARFYSARAFKTACVWSYWGKWREARALRTRFRRPGDRDLPYYWASLFCSTPFGAAAGAIARKLAAARVV
jgi:hypothetical protein